MSDVFFSYASKDRERVRVAYDALKTLGFDVFWDANVPTAADWDRLIRTRLEQSRCVVVFWTKNAAESQNVRHEVQMARDQGKLVQVLLEPMSSLDLPMGTLLEQAAKLADWAGEPVNPEWTKLLGAIEDKAAPRWMRRKMVDLDVQIKAERKRIEEADARIRSLETAHDAEVLSQGALRRERDRLAGEVQRLANIEARAATLEAAQGALGLERDRLKSELQSLAALGPRLADADAQLQTLLAGQDALMQERARLATDLQKMEAAAKRAHSLEVENVVLRREREAAKGDALRLAARVEPLEKYEIHLKRLIEGPDGLQSERGRLAEQVTHWAQAAKLAEDLKQAEKRDVKTQTLSGVSFLFAVSIYLPIIFARWGATDEVMLPILAKWGTLPAGFPLPIIPALVSTCFGLLCVWACKSHANKNESGVNLFIFALLGAIPAYLVFRYLPSSPLGWSGGAIGAGIIAGFQILLGLGLLFAPTQTGAADQKKP